MGHTFTNLYHFVFSTKRRQPFLRPDIRDRIIRYMCGIARKKGGTPLRVNAVDEHVHMLVKLRPDVSVSDFLQHIKGDSSKWISDSFPEMLSFA